MEFLRHNGVKEGNAIAQVINLDGIHFTFRLPSANDILPQVKSIIGIEVV